MKNFSKLSNKQKDESVRVTYMLGFLFEGYKEEFYFWEIIITARKVLLVLVIVFLSTIGSNVQVLVSIFILVCALVLQVSEKPF